MQRPSDDSIRCALRLTYMYGCSDRFTPPASATSHSPRRSLSQASCTATSDDEHIVSIGMLGPFASRKYDTRFTSEQNDVNGALPCFRLPAPYKQNSARVMPANTPSRPPCSRAMRARVYAASSSASQHACRKMRS